MANRIPTSGGLKLNTNVQHIIIAELQEHGVVSWAAAQAGVSSESVHRWLSKGEELLSQQEELLEQKKPLPQYTANNQAYMNLAQAAARARAASGKQLVRHIIDAKDPKSVLALLERGHRKEFAPPTTKVEAKVEGKINLAELTASVDAALKKLEDE